MRANASGIALPEHAEAARAALVGCPSARFRDGQWEAVRDLVEHSRRGARGAAAPGGEPAVYFVATALQRACGAGPTIIVSPLLALMLALRRDQVAAAGPGFSDDEVRRVLNGWGSGHHRRARRCWPGSRLRSGC